MKYKNILAGAFLAAVLAAGIPVRAHTPAAPQMSFADKQVSDDLVYDNVKRRLAEDSEVKGGGLDIDVKQGVVTLRGKLETQRQIDKATRITKKVNGVKKVINEIQLSLKP
jgi:hyperosmotically inducible periplasmic protein